MTVSRRNFLEGLGLTAGALALPGCLWTPEVTTHAQVALHLGSIRTYIGGRKDKDGKVLVQGAGLAKAFRALSAIGYKGVEFAGYYGNDARTLKAMLDDNGLVACGTHVPRDAFSPAKVAATCEFTLGYGSNLVICPGDGNFPDKDEDLDDFLKRLVDYYNRAAADAAKYGCRVGLHNHMDEFTMKMMDGTSYWDYFFKNTDPAVCMEQDVGWTTCAGEDPCAQYKRYPHRSPTLHARENGAGEDVGEFDGILGKPGKPDARPVDWDALVPVAARDGVKWYVVECERHEGDLSAVLPSYHFLKSKGLG